MKKLLHKIHLENLHLENAQLKNAHREWKIVEKIDFQDPNSVPFHMHIGMRTVKTVLAVSLCGIIGWFLGQPPLFSMFAAILCAQNKTDDTIKSAYNRVLGTIVGGIYAVIIVQFSWVFSISHSSLLYYMLISCMLLPVICTTLYIRKPTTTSLACIVFIAITLTEFDGMAMNPLGYAIWRTVDTLIGIIIILLLELIFPYRPKKLEISC